LNLRPKGGRDAAFPSRGPTLRSAGKQKPATQSKATIAAPKKCNICWSVVFPPVLSLPFILSLSKDEEPGGARGLKTSKSDPMPDTHPPRIILAHKQSTSGRVRFLLMPHTGVCGDDPLPGGAALRDEDEAQAQAVLHHPAAVAKEAAEKLGLVPGDIAPEAGFHEVVDTATGPLSLFLGLFTAIDPPFAAAEAVEACFIPLTEIRILPPMEQELARRAYVHLMEG